VSRARLVLLAGAVLLPLGLLITRYLYGTMSYLPLIVGFAALLFLLVLGRMASLVTAQRKLAIIDGLTGLYAPEFLLENLRVECLRSRQHGQELGIMLVDVDNFGLINGAYGRPAGDWALNQLATRLRTATGGYGVVGRFRDDKFLIILPFAGTHWLGEAAEQVRETISSARVPVNDGALVRLTVSIGIAALPVDGETADHLIAVASRACAAAKRAGRNRTHGRHGSTTRVAGGLPAAALEPGAGS
jgi:diguanylate cyclase (GGDEF)-like protein